MLRWLPFPQRSRHRENLMFRPEACVALTVVYSLVGISHSSIAWSQEKAGKPKFKAVSPEIQTAKWAEKWWMPRHEQKVKALKKQGRVDLLMIGDSITHGWENAGKKVWQKYYADRHAFNIGFSGDRTEQVLWRLDHGEVSGISPKLAVIMIGTNNTGHRQDPAVETAAGIQAILTKLDKKLPQTKVLLLGIFPRGAAPNDKLRKRNRAINKILATYEDKQRVFYLDLGKQFLTQDGRLPRDIMPDLLHPNTRGYELWAKAMEPMVAKFLGDQAR